MDVPASAAAGLPANAEIVWRPNPGRQMQFLAHGAFEVLYGGAAGGGKSDALLAGALRHIDCPDYTAILFRRTFPDLERSLIEKSRNLYPKLGGRYNDQKKAWRFPSGARILFGHLEHESDVLDHQGAEYQYIGFDELTHFTEKQYTYLLSRARSSKGIPVRIRAATNPGGPGHEWVLKRWGPWLNAEFDGPHAGPGETLWCRPGGAGEVYCRPDEPDALSRSFVPAKVADNPHLAESDPGYVARLKALDPVTRARLLDGDWRVRPARGLYFKRSWLEIVPAAPAVAKRIRYWDRAATEEKPGEDPDWTVGLKLSKTADGLYFVEHVVRLRGTPGEVERAVKQTAQLDGGGIEIGIEQDPGSAGKFEAAYYIRELAAWTVRAYPVSSDKITRAGPVSAQAQALNVKLVRGPWNESFLAELEGFPEGHDDQVDALSGAFSVLSPTSDEPWDPTRVKSRRSGW